MDSGLAENRWQIGWIDVAAGAKWKVLRSLNVGSAAAEKVSAAAEKSAAAAEKRSAVAKRGDCGGKTQGLRSRSVKAAFSGLRPCGLGHRTLRTQNSGFIEESEEESGRLQIRFVNNRSVVGHPKSRRREVVGNTCLQSGALMPKLPRGWRRMNS